MSDENRGLHIVVFPWLAFGHMLPSLELAKALARKGHKISFISTPRNLQRLPKPPPQISNLLHFIPLPLLPVDGLPADAEATSDLPAKQVPYLKKAHDSLEQPFRQFIQETTPKPDWILQDFTQHWIPDIAAEAGVPSIFMTMMMAGTHVFFGPTSGDVEPRMSPEQFTVPPPWVPFPSNLCFRLHEARKIFSEAVLSHGSGFFPDSSRYHISLEKSQAVAIRSSEEAEPEWLKILRELIKKPVFPVGLLTPTRATEERGEKQGGDAIIEWLDKQRPSSVTYIAFGSESVLSTELLHELARGLELANLPFLWVLRKPIDAASYEELMPEGFEERTKDYGMVAKGWVPQLKILAHKSIGGFLSHSGWSSVIESLLFGHPMVQLPLFGDQALTARVAMEKGIAVEIERDEEDGSFTKEAVAAAVKLAVLGEEGESLRRRAKELGEILLNKEREEKYIDEFISYLKSHGTTATEV